MKNQYLLKFLQRGLLIALIIGLCVPIVALGEGSWGQINQEIKRPEGWQSFVTQSQFQLGEKSEIGELGGKPLYQAAFGTYPSIDGSTVAVPMAIEFARQHLQSQISEEDMAGFVFFSTTHGAYENLIYKRPNGSAMIASQNTVMDDAHPVDIIIATEPSDDELALAAQNNITLITKPVCYDAFVFITHKDNPVQSLTVRQIQDIYTGKITNWKEVGGADETIIPYQREANSGSQTAMEKLVMQGKALSGATENYITEGMGSLIRHIGEYENSAASLGYTYLYYINILYKSDDIKILAIDGIDPSNHNIQSNLYPFTTNYYGVIRQGEESATGGLFLDWMLSEQGQKAIGQAGYIPMGAE